MPDMPISAYGLPQAAEGGVPAGGDQDEGYFVMSAPIDAHMRIISADFVGGDASESYQLRVWPAGTTFPASTTNSIVWAGGSLAGAQADPIPILQSQDRQSVGWNIIPAGWSLGLMPISAGSAAAATVRIVGVPMQVAP